MKDVAQIRFEITLSGNEKIGKELLDLGKQVLNAYLEEEKKEESK